MFSSESQIYLIDQIVFVKSTKIVVFVVQDQRSSVTVALNQ